MTTPGIHVAPHAKFESHSPEIPDLRIDTQALPTVVGRSGSADLNIADPLVSRRHCSLEMRGDDLIIRDLESTNGTLVNGEAIESDHVLSDGEVILLGGTEFTVRHFSLSQFGDPDSSQSNLRRPK